LRASKNQEKHYKCGKELTPLPFRPKSDGTPTLLFRPKSDGTPTLSFRPKVATQSPPKRRNLPEGVKVEYGFLITW